MQTRLFYLFGLLLISFILLGSVYLQVVVRIMPCPLCVLQRFTFGILGLLCLTGFFISQKRRVRIFINLLLTFFSLIGMLLAGRQIWIQYFSVGKSSECAPSLEYMISVLPWNQLLAKILEGGSECSKRGWELLHLNIAEWSFIWFTLFLLISFCLLLREIR